MGKAGRGRGGTSARWGLCWVEDGVKMASLVVILLMMVLYGASLLVMVLVRCLRVMGLQ